jgi:hypothetical protein
MGTNWGTRAHQDIPEKVDGRYRTVIGMDSSQGEALTRVNRNPRWQPVCRKAQRRKRVSCQHAFGTSDCRKSRMRTTGKTMNSDDATFADPLGAEARKLFELWDAIREKKLSDEQLGSWTRNLITRGFHIRRDF